jgi:hypothetical protein
MLKEALLERLREGPGAAARQELAVGASGPEPCRWTVRTLRVSGDWLSEYTGSGVWRVLQTCGLPLRASCARRFSPEPDYRRKVQRLHRCLRAAARHPQEVVALFLAEFSYYRWPEVAPTWGAEAAVAQRTDNTQHWRTIGCLNARTGQVNFLDGYIVGRRQVSQFYGQIAHGYPKAELRYVIQDNWNIPTHPEVLAALAAWPRLKPVWLPTYAPWLNPIEKLWRWVRQDVLKMHRGVEDWPRVNQWGRDFLTQFAHGSQDLLHYVGLRGKGKLATVLSTA